MVLDLAKPVAFLLCILSLTSVFHAAFLLPATTLDDRLHAGLLRLSLAAAIAVVAALIFRESEMEADARFDVDFRTHFGTGFDDAQLRRPRLVTTLPMQLFCWSATSMAILFALAWYFESYGALSG